MPGWWTCGYVNGKNRMGGYVGFRRFIVVERDGVVVYRDVGTGEQIDFLEIQCQASIDKGVLPIADVAPRRPAPGAPQMGIIY